MTPAYAESVTLDVTRSAYVGLARERRRTEVPPGRPTPTDRVLRRVSQGGDIMRMYELWKLGTHEREASRLEDGSGPVLFPRVCDAEEYSRCEAESRGSPSRSCRYRWGGPEPAPGWRDA